MSISKSKIAAYEAILKNRAYEEYELWISNFALNLNDIWNEQSASILSPSGSSDANKHLSSIKRNYDDPIVDEYGSGIKAVFSVVSHPDAVRRARKSGMKIHWMHSLVDYNEGKKSFNYITSIMVRAKNHSNGLPAIQTGANVGTSSWFVGWKILKCNKIALIGINHGWEEDDPWDLILSHTLNNNELPTQPIEIDKSTESFKKLFPKLYNPDLDSYFILDPIFQLYRSALLEFIERSPDWLYTYNATEGGSIFGSRVKNITLKESGHQKGYHLINLNL